MPARECGGRARRSASTSNRRGMPGPRLGRMGVMDSTTGGASQRRALPRLPVRAKVRMEFPEERFFLSEWAVNLSPGGMFVRTEAALAPGQRFEFEASLTPKGPRFAGKGQVLWVRREWDGTTRPPGFAVRFLALEED